MNEHEMTSVIDQKVTDIRTGKKPWKNTIEQDFAKGNVRNQPCPNCQKKLKKCQCGFLNQNADVANELL